MKYRYTTRLQIMTAIRDRFRTSRGLRASRLAEHLETCTDDELAVVFGSAGPVNIATLRARLSARAKPMKDAKAMVGE